MKCLLLILAFAVPVFAQAGDEITAKVVTGVAQTIEAMPNATWKEPQIIHNIAPGVGEAIIIKLPVSKKTPSDVAKAIAERVKAAVLPYLEKEGYTKRSLWLVIYAVHADKQIVRLVVS